MSSSEKKWADKYVQLTKYHTAFLPCVVHTHFEAVRYAPLGSVTAQHGDGLTCLSIRYGIVLDHEKRTARDTSDVYEETEKTLLKVERFGATGFPSRLDKLTWAMAQGQKFPLIVHTQLKEGKYRQTIENFVSVEDVTLPEQTTFPNPVFFYCKAMRERAKKDYDQAVTTLCLVDAKETQPPDELNLGAKYNFDSEFL